MLSEKQSNNYSSVQIMRIFLTVFRCDWIKVGRHIIKNLPTVTHVQCFVYHFFIPSFFLYFFLFFFLFFSIF